MVLEKSQFSVLCFSYYTSFEVKNMITISKFQRRHRHWRCDSYEKDDPLMQGDLCHWKIAVAISVIRHQAIPGQRRDVRRAPHRLHWNQLGARAQKGIIIIKKSGKNMEKAVGKRGVVSPPSRDGWNCPQLVLKLPFVLFLPLSLSLGKKVPYLHPPKDTQDQELLFSLCIWGLISAWPDIHVRASLCGWFVNLSPPLHRAQKKEVVSNRKLSWAITLWALQIPVYKATCLIYVQDRSLRCQGVLSESTRHSCTRG